MIKTFQIQEGQTLFDVALMLYGDVTRVIDLCRLNPDTIPNVLKRNIKGLTINYEVQNNQVTKQIADKGIVMATLYPEYVTTASAFSVAFSPAFVPAPVI